jgi:CrcB protein
MLAVAVGLLAGLGAVVRYAADQYVRAAVRSEFPYGTLVVNVTGSFVLGLVTGLSLHAGLPHGTSVALGAGFCGGFTTWSTFAFETGELAEQGARGVGRAAANVGTSITLGLLAAAAGFGLALL